MRKHNLGRNWNGTHTEIHVDDDEMIARDVQSARDIKSILDNNARMRALGRNPNSQAVGRHVASVPITVYCEWLKEWKTKYRQDWSWQTYMTMKLNSRDYSALKTNEMRL